MTALRTRLAAAAARAAAGAARAAGRGATSLPGKVLLRGDPRAVERLAAGLPQGCAVISATNGKTTTAAMAAAILEADGTQLVHNRSGANMAGGIAATLLAQRGDLGLFEVDEFWLDSLVARPAPARAAAGEPVPRPARPLWRARHDRRALGAGRRLAGGRAPGAERRRPDDRGSRAAIATT